MKSLPIDERDAAGELTAMALAVDALIDNGCDCGEDEPGTCLACRCEAALREECARAEAAEAKLANFEEQLKKCSEKRNEV